MRTRQAATLGILGALPYSPEGQRRIKALILHSRQKATQKFRASTNSCQGVVIELPCPSISPRANNHRMRAGVETTKRACRINPDTFGACRNPIEGFIQREAQKEHLREAPTPCQKQLVSPCHLFGRLHRTLKWARKAVYDAAWTRVKQHRKTVEDPVSNRTVTEPMYKDLAKYLAKVLGDTLAPFLRREPPEDIRTLMREIREKQELLEQKRRPQVTAAVQ